MVYGPNIERRAKSEEEYFHISIYVASAKWRVSGTKRTSRAFIRFFLESKIPIKLRQDFTRLNQKEQVTYDEEELDLKQSLSLSPDKAYATRDLEDDRELDRASRLFPF